MITSYCLIPEKFNRFIFCKPQRVIPVRMQVSDVDLSGQATLALEETGGVGSY